MDYVQVSEILSDGKKFLGSQVKVAGWVRTARDSKTMAFLALNDGSSLKHLQIVVNNTCRLSEKRCFR